MPDDFDKLVSWLLANAKANEWQIRHAAENSYCPYCTVSDDLWHDQKEHHPGCQYAAMMKLAEEMVQRGAIDNA